MLSAIKLIVIMLNVVMLGVLVHYIVFLFPFHKRKSMFAIMHSYISTLKSGLLHFTGHSNCKKIRSSKVKDGIINIFLRNYLID